MVNGMQSQILDSYPLREKRVVSLTARGVKLSTVKMYKGGKSY